MLTWGWSRKGLKHVAMLGCWWLYMLLCPDKKKSFDFILFRRFCNSYYTSVKINRKCLRFIPWLILSIPLAATSQQCCWNTPSAQQSTITHKFQNAGRSQKTWVFFPTHHTAHILLPQIITSLELSKMPPARKGLGMLTRLLKKWLLVQDSNWYKEGIDALFSY